MTIKDKRSIFFLFVAMLASSLIIGSYCQTRFAPVDLAQYAEESPASDKPSSHDEFSANNKLSQKSENDDSNNNNSKK